MRDIHTTGPEPCRQHEAAAKTLHKVTDAPEDQRAFANIHIERNAEAVAEIFLKAGWPSEALRRMHHLRKAVAACIDAGPYLPPADLVFAHRHDTCHMGTAIERQRRADQTGGLRKQPAGAAQARLQDFAGVNRSSAAGEAL